MGQYETLAQWIHYANKVVFITGAGVSTPSGIPDFQTQRMNFDSLERYLSRSYLNRYPKLFWEKYKDIFQLHTKKEMKPNEGHNFIADLEKLGKNVTVLTQNVDGLHQKAGSTNVIELHGNIQKGICPKCKTDYDLDYMVKDLVPRCNRLRKNRICNFILEPDVVLYGDNVRSFSRAEEVLLQGDVLLVMGTSLSVAPTNKFPEFFCLHVGKDWNRKNCKMALLNLDSTEKDYLFPIVINEEIITAINKLKVFLRVLDRN